MSLAYPISFNPYPKNVLSLIIVVCFLEVRQTNRQGVCFLFSIYYTWSSNWGINTAYIHKYVSIHVILLTFLALTYTVLISYPGSNYLLPVPTHVYLSLTSYQITPFSVCCSAVLVIRNFFNVFSLLNLFKIIFANSLLQNHKLTVNKENCSLVILTLWL